jgi:hypothetical protein
MSDHLRRLQFCSPLHIARCGARSNRRSQATVRSLLLKALPGCLFVRRQVRETDDRIGLRFGPRPGADPTVHHTSKSSPCHGGTPVRSRCVGRSAQRAHSLRTTAASTVGMGRRIMAERRRPRTGRGRRYRVRARVRDSGSNASGADASLRAFVRALARQAARECFELELKQRSRTIQ